MDITGAVALVTGGGSGIGRATSEALAAEGARVAVVDVDEGGGKETVERIRAKGGEARFVQGDVSTPSGIAALFSAVVDALGVPTIVFNNAGIMTADTPGWPEATLERVHLVVSVNASGVIMGTRQAVEAMRGKGGVVINTASTAALGPLPLDPVYASTKALVAHFTRSCAELATTHGVRVNAVLPGVTDTPILLKSGDGTKASDWVGAIMAEVEMIPPDAVARCVLGLIRDDSASGVCRVVEADGERDV
jgi:NAD(P)-dependent dehydrogenase (short-subunit alcohol dehydrogenase family)